MSQTLNAAIAVVGIDIGKNTRPRRAHGSITDRRGSCQLLTAPRVLIRSMSAWGPTRTSAGDLTTSALPLKKQTWYVKFVS
jgi:hypothetical protein